ncbi:MAG: peptide chain release factor 1 [Paenibacillaceae bacterium]|nr:peptide chain release factor 1 [Paenibacillaceae bacterium]
MVSQVQPMIDRYELLSELLCDPDISFKLDKLRAYSKEQSELQPVYDVVVTLRRQYAQRDDVRAMLDEALEDDMRTLVKIELDALNSDIAAGEAQLHALIQPRDPYDGRDVIVEIRGAAGGEEAALFAAVLYRMYAKYADAQGWRVDVIEASESDLGGFKEIIFTVKGQGVYRKLKYESGAHRVQRVPDTESSGRIHTSTATVVVMPEIEDVDVEIRDADIRVDTFCSSGAGGQSVNTTKSAVRVTHIPTGIVATCQDGKSQNSNKELAMRVLRARIYEKRLQEETSKYDAERKAKVGTGDRSERIRTYNYPQSRVTDHRIGLTIHRLAMVLDGDLDEFVAALAIAAQNDRVESGAT